METNVVSSRLLLFVAFFLLPSVLRKYSRPGAAPHATPRTAARRGRCGGKKWSANGTKSTRGGGRARCTPARRLLGNVNRSHFRANNRIHVSFPLSRHFSSFFHPATLPLTLSLSLSPFLPRLSISLSFSHTHTHTLFPRSILRMYNIMYIWIHNGARGVGE